MIVKGTFDMKRVAAKLDGITKASGEAVRPAAQAGAEIFYQQVKANAPVSKKDHWFHGTHAKYFMKSGTLRDAIYQAYSRDNSGDGKATYHIAWNHQKAPYGFMVEFGTSRMPAGRPFLRPAYASRAKDAMEAAKSRMLADIKKVL